MMGGRFLAVTILGLIAWAGCSRAESRQAGEMVEEVVADTQPPAVVMTREDADRLWAFAESPEELGSGAEFHIFVDPETFPDARASFAEFGLGAGGTLPVHRHDRTEEIAYFLSGEGEFTLYEADERKDVPVGAGYVAYTPPGAWHAIRNTGDEPLTLVFATVPNEEQGLLSFFRRIGVEPGKEATPLSPEEFGRIAAEHDLILRPPDTE